MDLELSGKIAIVTGGSRGIGKAVARELAGEGARVAIVARGPDALNASAAELGHETGSTVIPVVCDTGSDEAVRAMAAEVVERLGGVDILVNCAARPGGQAPPLMLEAISEDVFRHEMNVKVMGYLRCIREVVPHMARRGGGRIVNVGGLAVRSTGSIVDSIRNAGVAALTKNLADELGHRGITVIVVHPALTRTEATASVVQTRADLLGVTTEEVERQIARANALGRVIDARYVAYVIAFLASPKSVAVNGDAVIAGGGVPGAIYY